MSNPSFSNIDRWLFELNEGNLSPEQIEQLEAFLLRHPELDVDKDMWELARIEKEEVVYTGQQRFIRRRPVGLYMAAGLASITAFVIIAINLYMLSPVSQGNVIADSNTPQSQKVNRVSEVGSAVNETASNLTAVNDEQADQSIEYIELIEQLEQLNAELIEARTVIDQLVSGQAVADNTVDDSNFEGKTTPTELSTQVQISANELAGRYSEDELQTKPVQELESSARRNWNTSPVRSAGQRFSTSDYSESFSSRLNKMTRAVSRMLDNPVALKNLKDPVFHLPGMLPADVNFGNTGTLPATRIQTLSRLQWYGQENEQLTNQLAIDGYIYSIRGGVGVQFNNSYYGDGQIMNSNVALTYSPKFSVSRNILIEPSLRFKMGNKVLNEDKLTGFGFAEMERDNVHEFYPSGTAPVGRQLWYRDLGAGLMVNTKWFFTGLQIDNIFRHYDNIYSDNSDNERRVGTHFVATIGTDYESKKEQIGLSPYLVYQKSERLNELWGGMNIRLRWFTLGGAVSDRLDLSGSAGLKFSRFSVNYQADYLFSSMLNKQMLSHQLALKFITFNPNKRQKFLTL